MQSHNLISDYIIERSLGDRYDVISQEGTYFLTPDGKTLRLVRNSHFPFHVQKLFSREQKDLYNNYIDALENPEPSAPPTDDVDFLDKVSTTYGQFLGNLKLLGKLHYSLFRSGWILLELVDGSAIISLTRLNDIRGRMIVDVLNKSVFDFYHLEINDHKSSNKAATVRIKFADFVERYT